MTERPVRKIKSSTGFSGVKKNSRDSAFKETARASAQDDSKILSDIQKHWCKCPLSGSQMYEIEYEGQKLDASGHGIYLDPGELEEILSNKKPFWTRLFGLHSPDGIPTETWETLLEISDIDRWLPKYKGTPQESREEQRKQELLKKINAKPCEDAPTKIPDLHK